MLNLSGQELQAALSHLDQAIYNHGQWYMNLQRVLIARVPADESDLLPDSYQRCRFGQWYDGDGTDMLGDHPGFIAVGQAHRSTGPPVALPLR